MSRPPRSIEELARDPSPESWRLLCEALADLPEAEAMSRIATIESDLEAWDPKLRATMCGMDWDNRFFAGTPDPRSTIVRFLRFDRIFFGRHGGMRMRSPYLGISQMAGLASSPAAGRLTRMDFSYHPLGEGGVRALARGRHFTSLVELRLTNCNLDSEAMQVLAGAPFYSQLREVSIRSNDLRGHAIAPLVATEDLALERLELGGNPLGVEGAAVLADARPASLLELELSDCSLGVEGASALSRHARSPLDKLDVSSSGLGDDGLAALASGSLRARALTLSNDSLTRVGLLALLRASWPLVSLTLSNNAIDDDAVRSLVDFAPETLEELTIEDNDVTGAGLAALLGSDRLALRTLNVTGNRVDAEAMRRLGRTMRTIQALWLGENRVEDEGVGHLAGAQADQLRELSLVRNGVTARALERLTGAPWFGGLTTLDLAYNPLGAAAGLVLGARPLLSLTLTACGLGDEGAVALAAAEFRPTTLALSECDLTDRGVEAIASSPILSNVETLSLGRNHITDRGVLTLVRSKHTSSVKVVHLEGNRIGDIGAVALAEWGGPLAFHVEGNPIGAHGKSALKALPPRCCP